MALAKLDTNEAALLQTRVFISKHVGAFSLPDLAGNWAIGKTTIYRYVSTKYRAASRENAHRRYLIEKENRRPGICERCEKPLEGHARCICTRLTHGERCCT